MRLTPERHALALRRIAVTMCLSWLLIFAALIWRIAC